MAPIIARIDVPHVRADTYTGALHNGYTRPALFMCSGKDGNNSDYVVKFRRKLGPAIICELMAALIGQQLGLPIPPVAIVEIDPRIAALIPDPDLQALLAEDTGPHFGSRFRAGGLLMPPVEFSLPKTMTRSAVDVFAFDMLVQNPDRSLRPDGGKPNLLVESEQFVIFDHEKAFSFLSDIGPSRQPWELRGFPFVKNHIFFKLTARCAMDDGCLFDAFLSRLDALSESLLRQIVNAIPETWQNPGYSDKITWHITTIRENRPLFERGLREALA